MKYRKLWFASAFTFISLPFFFEVIPHLSGVRVV
jgi:hypothetical protein